MLLLRLALAIATLTTTGCATWLRQPVTPTRGRTPEAPWSLQPELLTPPGTHPRATQRILFVVDVVAGRPPERAALDTLVDVAARYGERPASWIALGDPALPGVYWSPEGRLEGSHLLSDRTSYIFVRYTGNTEHFGCVKSMGVAGTRGWRQIYTIEISQERHRPFRIAWLNQRHLEAQTLIHCYGHILGLPSPSHGFGSRGSYCANPDCPLTLPTTRSIFYGIYRTGLTFRYLEDYCDECKRDIREAKEYWARAWGRSWCSPGGPP